MKLPVVIVLVLAAVYRLAVLRRGATFIAVTYAAAVALVAAAFAVAAGETRVDDATAPYISDFLEHGLTAAAGLAANLFLLGLKSGRPSRREAIARVVIGAAVLLGMLVTFLLSPIHANYAGDLDTTYGDLGTVMAYRLIFNGYLTYVLVDNVRLCRRYAAAPGDSARSLSLRLVGWGSLVAIAYSVSRVLYVLADAAGAGRPTIIRTVGSVSAAVGLAALAIGILAPLLARQVGAWVRAIVGIRRLGLLWRAVTSRWPDLVLRTPPPLTPRRAELRFDRRVIEVSEGLMRAGVSSAIIRRLHQFDPTNPQGNSSTERHNSASDPQLLHTVAEAYFAATRAVS